MADTLYQLTVRKGPKVGETFLLETFSLTIGRDPVSDVVLNDPEVSRQHARFSRTDSGYQVQDLGSTNGTFVNGQRLEAEPANLQPGYTISMGSGVTLVYERVPTGAALEATMIDRSGLAGMAPQGSSQDEPEDEWEAAVPAPPPFDDEPEIPSDWEPDPSPPFTPPPPAYTPEPPPVRPQPTATAPFVPTAAESQAASHKRRNTIIAVVVALILLCCCVLLLYMWFYGGDLLLESLGLV